MKDVETLCFTRPVDGAMPHFWGMDDAGQEVFFRTMKPAEWKSTSELFEEVLKEEVRPAGLRWQNPVGN